MDKTNTQVAIELKNELLELRIATERYVALVLLQVILVGMKLDGFLQWPWYLIAAPSALFLAYVGFWLFLEGLAKG